MNDWIGAVESIATIAALVIGGLWTYRLFIRTRSSVPRLGLSHACTVSAGPNGAILLQVTVRIENLGDVLVKLGRLETWIQQISPIPNEVDTMLREYDPHDEEGTAEFPWPLVASRSAVHEGGSFEIEPGESDEYTYDFLLSGDLREIQVYTHVDNTAKPDREIGWSKTTRLAVTVNRSDGPAYGYHLEEPMSDEKSGGREKVEKQRSPKPRPGRVQEQRAPKPRPQKKVSDSNKGEGSGKGGGG